MHTVGIMLNINIGSVYCWHYVK